MLKMERFKEAQTNTVLSECGSGSDVSLAQGNWANINSGCEGDEASGEVRSLLVENNDRFGCMFRLTSSPLVLCNNVFEVILNDADKDTSEVVSLMFSGTVVSVLNTPLSISHNKLCSSYCHL